MRTEPIAEVSEKDMEGRDDPKISRCQEEPKELQGESKNSVESKYTLQGAHLKLNLKERINCINYEKCFEKADWT